MISLDTNVLVRSLVNDDEIQGPQAKSIIENNQVWLSKTVIQETEWVLRFSYEFPKAQVHEALRLVFGLPQVEIENADQLMVALRWHQAELDFSDALHLAAAQASATMLTFDKRFFNKAKSLETKTSVRLV